MPRFSLFFNATHQVGSSVEVKRNIIAQVVAADQLGFHGVWVAEHHFGTQGHIGSPLLLLAHLAGLTKNIALGTAIVEAPLYNPIRLAEDTLLTDELSEGRVRLGLGSGGQHKQAEFEALGVELENRHTLLSDAALRVLEGFRQDAAAGSERHWSDRADTLYPRPNYRLPDPAAKIWLASGDTTAAFSGEHGFGLLLQRAIDPERRTRLIAEYETAARVHGQTARVAPLVFVLSADTRAAAYAIVESSVLSEWTRRDGAAPDWDGNHDDPSFQEALRRSHYIVGTDEDVYDGLQRLIEQTHADEVLLQTYQLDIRHEEAAAANRRLAREVLPALGRHFNGLGSPRR